MVKDEWYGKYYICECPAEFETDISCFKYLCKDHAQLAMCAGIKIKPIFQKAKEIWDLI